MRAESLSTARQCYDDAKRMLAEKDLLGFITEITKAEVYSEADHNFLAEVLYLKAKGLLDFNHYKESIKAISEALIFNSGIARLKLLKFKGIALGYLGDLKSALKLFNELVSTTEEDNLLVELYTNIIWANLLLYKTENNGDILENVKRHLDLIEGKLECLAPAKKRRFFINSSTYYAYCKEYDQGIELLLQAIDYSDEKNLSEIYNNLAALYLESDKDGISRYVGEYTKKAEILASRNKDSLEVAKSFFTSGMAELREGDYLKALDSLYLSLKYFKEAEAYPFALDCMMTICSIENEYKVECLKLYKQKLKNEFGGTGYIEIAEEG